MFYVAFLCGFKSSKVYTNENIVFVTTVPFDNHSYTPLDYMEVTRIADPRWLDAVATWSDDFERMDVGTWVRVKDLNPFDLIT